MTLPLSLTLFDTKVQHKNHFVFTFIAKVPFRLDVDVAHKLVRLATITVRASFGSKPEPACLIILVEMWKVFMPAASQPFG